MSLKPSTLPIALLFIHTITALPSLQQSWAAHKRALLQADVGGGNDNTTVMGLKLPIHTADDKGGAVTNPFLDNIVTTMTTTTAKPTEQQAEQLLKLMLASLDRGDVKSIAMKLMPEYTKFCLTTLDCEELHSALRRLYLTRYSELQLALHRMDKLGLLLRRVQYLAEQGALDAASIRPTHHRRHTLKRSWRDH